HRLTSITDAADVAGGVRPVRKFEYDSLNRRTAVIDPDGRRTSFTYDLRGRLVTTTYADGTTDIVTYGYNDLAGMIVEKTDRTGIVTDLIYDTTRRLIVTMSGGKTDVLQYFRGRYIVSNE